MTDHREMEHRDACHDGRWDASCAECHGYEVRGQTRLLEAIHDTLLGDREPHDAEDFICEGCGRHLPCRHCLDEPDTLVEALDALPEETVVYDGRGTRMRRETFGGNRDPILWVSMGEGWGEESHEVAAFAPIGIESIPGEDVLPEPLTLCDNFHAWKVSDEDDTAETCLYCGTWRRKPKDEHPPRTAGSDAEWHPAAVALRDASYEVPGNHDPLPGLPEAEELRAILYANGWDITRHPSPIAGPDEVVVKRGDVEFALRAMRVARYEIEDPGAEVRFRVALDGEDQ